MWHYFSLGQFTRLAEDVDNCNPSEVVFDQLSSYAEVDTSA